MGGGDGHAEGEPEGEEPKPEVEAPKPEVEAPKPEGDDMIGGKKKSKK